MKRTHRSLAHLLVTLCCAFSEVASRANPVSPSGDGPSIAEQLQALTSHSTAIRDAHGSALRVLEGHSDFSIGLRSLRRDLAQLTERLPQDLQLTSLGDQARNLAAQLAQQLPDAKVDADTASHLDRDALTLARRAETLRHEITAIREELQDTLVQAQKWENAYYAFDFDPRRQRQILRALVADHRHALTNPAPPQRIEPDPELPTSIASLSNPPPIRESPPLLPLIPPSSLASSPLESAEPQIELRRALVPASPLQTALAQAQANPDQAKAQHHLNNECFKLLTQVGPKILQPSSQVQLPAPTMQCLEAAARLKVPAALHLLGLMHLTGQGSGLNYPRGTAYLKEAAKRLDSHPDQPFGPGVKADEAAAAIPQVGTSWFWLAECYLLGLMEQKPETAATLYRSAADYGDPRAHLRIRQLTAVDRSRVYISWPSEGEAGDSPTLLGLVEHCGTDLDELETNLATKSTLTPPKTPLKAPRAAQSDIVRPYLGIDFTPNYPSRGVSIRKVIGGSPAAQVGLLSGDLIVQVNDRSTSTLDDFYASLNPAKPGDLVKLRVIRPNQPPLELNVKLGTITSVNEAIEAVLEPLSLPSSWNPHQVGFLVMAVRPNSTAALAGLLPGDIAIGANDRHLRQWNDFASSLHNRHGVTNLLIQRRLPGQPPQLLSIVISSR